jgi:hypothetical protein
MTTKEHTPAPLSIEKVKTGRGGGFYDGHARKEADANLFAAAPELLESCKYALARLMADKVSVLVPTGNWGTAEANYEQVLRAAIAKAEGK